MNITEISEKIKANIEELSVEDIKQQFVDFAQLVLQQHLNNNAVKEKQQLIERINNGGTPRPVLVVKVGIENLDPNHISGYIENIAKSMRAAIPYSEYVYLVVPQNDSNIVSIEMLSPFNMDDIMKEEFNEKYGQLEKIISDYFEKPEKY